MNRLLPLAAASLFALALPTAAAAQAPDPADACTRLAGLTLAATKIASAVVVHDPAKTFGQPTLAGVPDFCRVVAHVRAAPDSDIAVEVWLPLQGWTGVFHGNGNGGFGGTLAAGYGAMVAGLRRGYASAVTDTGTAPATPLDGDTLTGHPRKWRDWGRLSTHVMTITGKAIAQAFYGRAADRAYYTGCSTGGQQGLIEALYYPADYDGILVGAPVVNRTWGHAAVAWDYATAHRTSGSVLSDAKLDLLNKAAIATCLQQGHGFPGDAFVTDPLACRFDPAAISCRDGATAGCLTSAEVATARAFYSGPHRRDGSTDFYGWPVGSEGPGMFGWSFLQTAAKGEPQFGGLFRWVFGTGWTWRGFDIDRDMPVVDAKLGPDVNDATRGSLAAFAKRGGKLVIYHGLADALVPPAQTVAFYQRQARSLGGLARLRRAARLFMVPGVEHCGGGTGPDLFNSAAGALPPPPVAGASDDLFAALVAWTRDGAAPDQVIATKMAGKPATIAIQRPVCAWPAKLIHTGARSMAPDSFRCVDPVSSVK